MIVSTDTKRHLMFPTEKEKLQNPPAHHVCVCVCARTRMHAQALLHPTLATPRSVAHQAPLSMGILQPRILEWFAIFLLQGSS